MTQAKPTSFPLRLSTHVSKFETTPERLKDIAEFLGVSQNKAAAYAINQLWKHLVENEEMLEELEFKRHGVKVGNVTYLNETEEALAERRANLKAKKPLPHILDKSLESNFMFAALPEEEKAIIRAASTPDEKRRLLAEAVERFCKEAKEQA
jgi:riboflavin biosynthesis pyrimidine reductase